MKTIKNQSALTNIAEYDYLGRGRLLERRYDNGTSLKLHDGATAIGYDPIKRLVRYEHKDNTSALISAYNYKYDKAHNRRFEQDLITGTADVYQYDSAYRLTKTVKEASSTSIAALVNNSISNADVSSITGVGDKSYTLDGVSNWIEKTEDGSTTNYTPNNMNEYTAIDAVAQVHSDNGNLTDDGTKQYFYDYSNRLVRIEESGSTIVSYTYDAANRRISKDVSGTVTNYYYDIARTIEEQNGSGTTLRQFVYGLGIDEQVEMTNSSGDKYYYHENSLGSVSAITDDTGAVIERYDYSDYGETTITDSVGTVIAVSAIGNPYGYTGRRMDTESGLYFYRARYYSAERGRFLQRDPLGYVDGMGLYTYARSNPLRFIDPMGTKSFTRSDGTIDTSKVGSFTDFLDLMFTDFPAAVISPRTGVASIPKQLSQQGSQLKRDSMGELKRGEFLLSPTKIAIGTTFEVMGGLSKPFARLPANVTEMVASPLRASGALGVEQQQIANLQLAVLGQVSNSAFDTSALALDYLSNEHNQAIVLNNMLKVIENEYARGAIVDSLSYLADKSGEIGANWVANNGTSFAASLDGGIIRGSMITAITGKSGIALATSIVDATGGISLTATDTVNLLLDKLPAGVRSEVLDQFSNNESGSVSMTQSKNCP
tara:strand:- start:722 stop:2692 length:1971 start_codon:yes stop_codon:yes gene_type:complete